MTHYSPVLNTDMGRRRSLRILNPNPDLPVAQIQEAVDQLLANDIFDQERGALDGLILLSNYTVGKIQFR